MGKSFMAVLSNSETMALFAADVAKGIATGAFLRNGPRAWTEMVAKSFLEPFGCGDMTKR